MNTPLLAFHNDSAIKAKYLARVQAHREADQLIQGTGWELETSKGCAVGCTLEAYDHSRYPIELGIPVNLAYAEDHIFERLPKDLAMAWPERFLTAIPIGADLSLVVDKAVLWMREQDVPPDDLPAEDAARSAELTQLFRRRIDGDEPTVEEWMTIERAARAARAAWDAMDAWAAWDAMAAMAAMAARDAWAAFYVRLSNQIIGLLERSGDA